MEWINFKNFEKWKKFKNATDEAENNIFLLTH